MRDLVIFGAGGYGKEVCQVIADVNASDAAWNVLGILDDNRDLHGQAIGDHPVLGGGEWLREYPAATVALAVGSPSGRRKALNSLSSLANGFATLIHPTAWLGQRVAVGNGTVVLAGAAVSTDIVLGDFVCLNKNCIVGHDVSIGDFTTISPGASISGRVSIGEGCDIGANSVVVQGLQVGAWSVVGAGAVVTRDLQPAVTAVGVPARVVSANRSR